MSKKLTFGQKITLWIVGIYIFVLFVGGFLSNCIIGREEPTIGQCTSNQLNMAFTLGINKWIEILQNKAEHQAENLQNKVERLSTLTGVINNTGSVKIPIIEPNVSFESGALKLNPEIKFTK